MISVIVPVHNEEEVMLELYGRLKAEAERWNESFEVLMVDDGSTDSSWQMIQQFHESDSRWKGIRLGRNFGHQAAISAGLHFSKGDCVIIMDADLQDPPEEIHRFIEKWKEGWDVVFALRTHRKEGLFKRFCYKAFYRMLSALSHVSIPMDAGDFCLMDRRVVNILGTMPERSRFIRGLRSWVGFRQTAVAYERLGRAAGKAKYTYGKLIKLALDGIVSFTSTPLKLATLLGFGTSVVALFAGAFFFLTRIFPGFFSELGFPVVPGFASVIIAVFFWAEFSSYAWESWENTFPAYMKKSRRAHFGPLWTC
ncbi:MAG TPA: glycosyltransferase family 2 protein [Desulfomonilaceae bacterium]|nr:glycosyltransferase family 2 protein [Desulfomonilaceae bacterium]